MAALIIANGAAAYGQGVFGRNGGRDCGGSWGVYPRARHVGRAQDPDADDDCHVIGGDVDLIHWNDCQFDRFSAWRISEQ